MEKNKIDLSFWTIFKFFLILALIWLLIQIKEILLLIFILLIITTALEPLVSWQEKNHLPRFWAVFFTYLVLLILLTVGFYLVIPPLVQQINKLIVQFPHYLQKFDLVYENILSYQSEWQNLANSFYKQLTFISGGIINAVLAIFGGVTTALTLFILSFYSLLEKKLLAEFLLSFIPQKNQPQAIKLSSIISTKLGGWLRGQVILSLTIGILDYIGLIIIGIPYALTLAIIAAVLEIIPVLGPVIAAITAVVVALLTGTWIQALIVLALFTIVQQLENHLLVPKIMGKAVGLSPVVIIIALLIGSKLGGITGAILAIPLAASLLVGIKEIQSEGLLKNQ